MALTKAERNKRTKERLERVKAYKNEYQKQNYKFLSIKFKLSDERDQKILSYIDSQAPKPKIDVIKDILYQHITNKSISIKEIEDLKDELIHISINERDVEESNSLDAQIDILCRLIEGKK